MLDQVREVICLKHYSIRAEKAYVNWIRRYILFHNKRHPKEMDFTRDKSRYSGVAALALRL